MPRICCRTTPVTPAVARCAVLLDPETRPDGAHFENADNVVEDRARVWECIEERTTVALIGWEERERARRPVVSPESEPLFRMHRIMQARLAILTTEDGRSDTAWRFDRWWVVVCRRRWFGAEILPAVGKLRVGLFFSLHVMTLDINTSFTQRHGRVTTGKDR